MCPRIALAIVFLLFGLSAAHRAAAQSTNLTISTAPDVNIALTPAIHPTGPGANLSVSTLLTQLAAASGQVAILTYGGFEGTPDSGEPGNIVVSSPITYVSNAGLELFIGSKNATTVNQAISISGEGFLTFAPLGQIDIDADLSATSGDIGVRIAGRSVVNVSGAITMLGIRGITISAQSNDGLTGSTRIIRPLTVASGIGQVSVFAEGAIDISTTLSVAAGYITVFSDHASIKVENGSRVTATAPNTRPGPNGDAQIFFGTSEGNVTLGDLAGGGVILVTGTDGPVVFQAAGDLDLLKGEVTTGGAFTATAGGDVTIGSPITAGGQASDPVLVLAGKSLAVGEFGSLQATGGASATLVVDNLNPTRPNLSNTAQLTNGGTLDLGPNGRIFAVAPTLTQLGSYQPAAIKFDVWYQDPGAIVGVNYKAFDPNTVPAIPTLSSVGLAALGLLLAFGSLRMLRRKRA